MRRISHRLMLGLTAWSGFFLAQEAKAQTARGATSPPPVTGIVNPYMNPYMNPYLNPAMAVGSTSRNDAMLYLWSAQQQPGALLGPRAAKPSGSARVAEMPKSAMQPGGSATKYFNRGPATAAGTNGLGKQYQRFNRYYSHNGR